MSRARRLESLLDGAKTQEKIYKWHEAARLYEHALGAVGREDPLRRGELRERVGYCLYRGAFQAKTQEEFKNRMQKAAGAYERAAEVYGEVDQAKSLYCHALALYARSWTQIDASQKKKVLDDCGGQLKEAMRVSEEAGDGLGHGKACTALLFCLWDRGTLEWDWTENNRHLEEAINHSQSAISTL
jgi:hypothetical protein